MRAGQAVGRLRNWAVRGADCASMAALICLLSALTLGGCTPQSLRLLLSSRIRRARESLVCTLTRVVMPRSILGTS